MSITQASVDHAPIRGLALAAVSVFLSVIGPKLLGDATNIIFDGFVGQQMGALGLEGLSTDQVVAQLEAQGQANLAAMLSTILGQENTLALAAVPVLNTALAMKQVLAGIFNVPFLALSLTTSVVYALLTLKLAVSMFERESVLFRA